MHLHYYKSLIILLYSKIFQQESIQTSSMVSKRLQLRNLLNLNVEVLYSGFQYTVRVFSVVIISCELL